MEELGAGKRAKPALRVVGVEPPPAVIDDSVIRECRMKRIRWLSKAYRLQWLIDQHCFGIDGPDCLDALPLRQLHEDMERARECASEGISFEDAGLVRSQPWGVRA